MVQEWSKNHGGNAMQTFFCSRTKFLNIYFIAAVVSHSAPILYKVVDHERAACMYTYFLQNIIFDFDQKILLVYHH